MKQIFRKRSAYLCVIVVLCVLLPLENLLWAKLRDYAISRVKPNSRQAFLLQVKNRMN